MLNKVGLGKRDFWWVALIVATIGYTGIFIPLRILYNPDIDVVDLVLNLLSSIVFIIFFCFHKTDTSWLIAESKETISRSRLNVVAMVPFEVVAWALPINVNSCWAVLLRMVSLVRLAYMIDFFKISYRCSFKLKAFAALICAIMALHWISLAWIVIQGERALERNSADQYISSLYWVVTTLTTVGYGDITPVSNVEKIFTMIIMIMGVAFYGVVIGTVSHAIFAANKYSQASKEKLEDISAFMRHYNVPIKLQKTVFAYCQNVLEKQLSDDDEKFIAELPHSLQLELNLYKKVGLIKDLTVFKGLTETCLRDVARALKSRFYSPGEKVIAKGETGYAMYIIARGSVNIICDDSVLATLNEGQFFGEIALLKDSPRTADVVSRAYSDIYILEKESFLAIAENHQQLFKTIQSVARERLHNSQKK
jgi:voltage-gated potassium channel